MIFFCQSIQFFRGEPTQLLENEELDSLAGIDNTVTHQCFDEPIDIVVNNNPSTQPFFPGGMILRQEETNRFSPA